MKQKSKMKQVIEFLISNPQYLEQIERQNHKRIPLPNRYERCAYKVLSYYFAEEMEKIGSWKFSPAQIHKNAFDRALCKLDFDTHNCLESSN